MAATAKSAKKAQKSDNILRRVGQGRLLPIDFFIKHWVYVVLGMGMIMIYITNRYQCLTLMEEIQRLEKELEIAKTERIRERSEYMGRIRESSMQELVESKHLNLKVQDQPPYRLPAKK